MLDHDPANQRIQIPITERSFQQMQSHTPILTQQKRGAEGAHQPPRLKCLRPPLSWWGVAGEAQPLASPMMGIVYSIQPNDLMRHQAQNGTNQSQLI